MIYIENGHYMRPADRPLGQIRYYSEHLENAREAGHPSLSSWVRELYREIGSASGVAAVIGVNGSTTIRWIKRLGLTPPKHGSSRKAPHPQRDEIGDLYRQLRSVRKVAAILNISLSAAYKWLRADSIKLFTEGDSCK